MQESPAAPPDIAESCAVPEHFRDGHFFNPGMPAHGLSEFLRWITNRKIGYWPQWIPSTPGPKPPDRVAGDSLRVTFVNHATVLLHPHQP